VSKEKDLVEAGCGCYLIVMLLLTAAIFASLLVLVLKAIWS
jgi:hypothetical protein